MKTKTEDEVQATKESELASLDSAIQQREVRLIELNESVMKSLEEKLQEKKDFNQKPESELFEATEALLIEQADLEQERAKIPAGIPPEVLAAKRNLLARLENDILAGSGDPATVDQKRGELKALEDEERAREANLQRIDARLTEISSLKHAAAQQVFNRNTAFGREEYRRIIAQALDQIEDIYQGLQQFSQTHGIHMSQMFLSQHLKLGHIGADRPVRTRIEQWIE